MAPKPQTQKMRLEELLHPSRGETLSRMGPYEVLMHYYEALYRNGGEERLVDFFARYLAVVPTEALFADEPLRLLELLSTKCPASADALTCVFHAERARTVTRLMDALERQYARGTLREHKGAFMETLARMERHYSMRAPRFDPRVAPLRAQVRARIDAGAARPPDRHLWQRLEALRVSLARMYAQRLLNHHMDARRAPEMLELAEHALAHGALDASFQRSGLSLLEWFRDSAAEAPADPVQQALLACAERAGAGRKKNAL